MATENPARRGEISTVSTRLTSPITRLLRTDNIGRVGYSMSVRIEMMKAVGQTSLAAEVRDFASAMYAASSSFDPQEVPSEETRENYARIRDFGMQQFGDVRDETSRQMLAYLFLANYILDPTGQLAEFSTPEAMLLQAKQMRRSLGLDSESRADAKEARKLSLAGMIGRVLDRRVGPRLEDVQARRAEEARAIPQISPVVFMMTLLRRGPNYIPDTGETTQANQEYERQYNAWLQSLHPVTRSLASHAAEFVEQQGASAIQRRMASVEAQRAQDVLDGSILAVGQSSTQEEAMANITQIIADAGLSDARDLITPARQLLYILTMATALQAIDQVCQNLDTNLAEPGFQFILFSTASQEDQEGGIINQQLESDLAQSTQMAIQLGITAAETVQAAAEGREVNDVLVNNAALFYTSQIFSPAMNRLWDDLREMLTQYYNQITHGEIMSSNMYAVGLDFDTYPTEHGEGITQRVTITRTPQA